MARTLKRRTANDKRQKTRAQTTKNFGIERDLKGVFWRTATLVIKRVFADSEGQGKYDNEKVLKMFSPSGTYFSILFPSNWWFKRMIEVGYREAEAVFAVRPVNLF